MDIIVTVYQTRESAKNLEPPVVLEPAAVDHYIHRMVEKHGAKFSLAFFPAVSSNIDRATVEPIEPKHLSYDWIVYDGSGNMIRQSLCSGKAHETGLWLEEQFTENPHNFHRMIIL